MIHHGNIALKAIEQKDFAWVAGLMSNPKIHGMLSPDMAEVTESNIAQHIGFTEPGTTVKGFIIVVSGMHAGLIVLNNIHAINRTACVSIIALDLEFQGKRFAREAGAALTEYAFGTLGIRKLYCFAYGDHHATARLARMAGAQKEAVLRKDLYRSGQYHDRIVWGLLREEYNGSISSS